jgi:glycine/D-amino acid oxidase-like deaminating enzyme
MTTLDVAVIGAGIHGASAAFHLATRGATVTVFDRGMPAGGPTGRSSAVCRAYYTNEFLACAARDSIRMMANFRELTGADSGFRRTGALFLHPPEDNQQVEEAVAELTRLGITAELLEPAEIMRRFPHFDLTGIGLGAWEADAGYADPAGTTLGLFNKAVELGAEPRLGRAVTGIQPKGSGAIVLTSDGARTPADRVLIAAGPWTGPLALDVGVKLPLTVERHIVGTFRWAGAEPMPLHADIVGGYYFKPEGLELFLVGPLHAAPQADPDDYSEHIGEEEVAALSRAVVRRVPHLSRAEVHGGWASVYDVSPDWMPVIGEIAPGIFVDAGTSGHGFKLAPALGAHVAALVMGERVPGLEQFHPRRFEGAQTLSAGYGEARILG